MVTATAWTPQIVGPQFDPVDKDIVESDITREKYLEDAAKRIVELVFIPGGVFTHADPDTSAIWKESELPPIKVSCSWALGTRKAIGTCHPRSHSECGKLNQLTISPVLGQADILGVLVHEMIHAVDDCKSGHGKVFRQMAIAAGLTGKMTATTPGDILAATLLQITEELGTYPHSILSGGKKAGKKDKNRMVKVECDDCGMIWRTAKTNLRGRLLRCPDTDCEDTHLTINGGKPL